MHQDIEKLLNTAKEKGSITEKQREIILSKAEKLGEDISEVEFILDDIPIKITKKADTSEKLGKINKCPHCGATITDTMISCPECGYVFKNEDATSVDARSLINDLKKQLNAAKKPLSKTEAFWSPDAAINRQVAIINAFSLQTTKEGLMLLLDFSYSNYISIEPNDAWTKPIKNAWYGKAVQACNMLSRLGSNNQEVRSAVDKYEKLLKNAKKDASTKKRRGAVILWGALSIIWALIIFGGYRGCKSEEREKVTNEVKECLKTNDFQCAKTAVNKLSGKEKETLYDEIVVQEITYLISQTEYDQATVVALTIYDKDKQDQMLNAINTIKKE